MSTKRDHLMTALLMHDNLIALQLVLMSFAFSAAAEHGRWALTGIMAALFVLYAAVFYFISPKIPQKYFKIIRYAPQAVTAALASLFFMPPLYALFCAAEVFIAELLLLSVNGRISASGVNSKLQLHASLVSAALLCAAFCGLHL